MFVDFNEGASAVFAERSGVSAERGLSVEEIVARHQQQQRAQDALVRNYIASARTQQHFRPTMTDPGYDVVTDNRYYVAERRHRVGRAFVLRQRIKVGRRPAAVPAAAAREGALPPASAAVRRRLSLPARRHRARRGVRLLCRAVRSRGERPVAVPGDDVDRAQYVRARKGVRGADRPLGAGRIQRGNPDIRADHSGRQQPGVSVRGPDGPADHPDCRAEHPRREDRRVRGFPHQRSSLRRGAPERTRKRKRDVPGNREGPALLREAGRGTGRQRTGDANGTGDGDGRDARSVVCVPSSRFSESII